MKNGVRRLRNFRSKSRKLLLERIRQKAEEHEDMRQRDLEWQDNIQAIRETYRLSDAEMKTIIREVEQEESDPPVEPQAEFVESSLFDQLTSLFFSPRGRIGRGVFALSLIATAIFQGMVVSISSFRILTDRITGLGCHIQSIYPFDQTLSRYGQIGMAHPFVFYSFTQYICLLISAFIPRKRSFQPF